MTRKIETEPGFFSVGVNKQNNPSLIESTCQHIAYGNANVAEEIIDINPEVLTQKGTVHDYSSRQFVEVTPIDATFLTGDVAMLSMIKAHSLRYFKYPHEVIAEHFHAFFPHGFKSHLRAQKSHAFDFEPIIAAIENATPIDMRKVLDQRDHKCQLGRDLAKFREAFDKHSLDEKIFNPQHLRAILKLYVRDFEDRKLSDDPKARIIRDFVIGYVQRYLPAHYMQALHHGPSNIYKDHEPLRRSFHIHGGSQVFPLKHNSGIGFGRFVGPHVFPMITGDSWMELGYMVDPGMGRKALVEFSALVDFNNHQFEKVLSDCVDYEFSPRCLLL